MATDYAALDTFGFILERESFYGSGLYQRIGHLQDVGSFPKLSRDEEDVTNHDSPEEIEEVLPTIGRVGTTDLKVVYDLADPTHVGSAGMRQDWLNKTLRRYRGTNPEDGVVQYQASGFVKEVGQDFPVKGYQMFNVTLRWTGVPDTIR